MMLTRVADFLDTAAVRIALAVFWLAPTIFLGVWAWRGAFMGVTGTMYGGDAQGIPFLSIAVLGLGGLLGLAGGWLRILTSNETLRTYRSAFWLTVLGVTCGIAVWAVMFLGSVALSRLAEPMYWAFLMVGVIGFVLLGATIGARTLRPNPTVERDGPQAARPSL